MNFNSNQKRGILGGIIATFVATVVILIILLVFILGSGVIKKMTSNDEGMRVFSEEEVGLDNLFTYLPNYLKLTRVKVSVRQGMSVEDAAMGVGYVK